MKPSIDGLEYPLNLCMIQDDWNLVFFQKWVLYESYLWIFTAEIRELFELNTLKKIIIWRKLGGVAWYWSKFLNMLWSSMLMYLTELSEDPSLCSWVEIESPSLKARVRNLLLGSWAWVHPASGRVITLSPCSYSPLLL